MKCPKCNSTDTRVIDTRMYQDGSIKRRRLCAECNYRFSTFERIDEPIIYVIKKDGGRVPFQKEKLLRGLKSATVKRNISIETLENIVTNIEATLHNNLIREVKSQQIGDMVLKKLIELDQVAYVRFASVYKEFDDIKSFIEIVEQINKE